MRSPIVGGIDLVLHHSRHAGDRVHRLRRSTVKYPYLFDVPYDPGHAAACAKVLRLLRFLRFFRLLRFAAVPPYHASAAHLHAPVRVRSVQDDAAVIVFLVGSPFFILYIVNPDNTFKDVLEHAVQSCRHEDAQPDTPKKAAEPMGAVVALGLVFTGLTLLTLFTSIFNPIFARVLSRSQPRHRKRAEAQPYRGRRQ